MRHLFTTLPLLFALTACDGEEEHEHDSGDTEHLNQTTSAVSDGGTFQVDYSLEPSDIIISEPFDMVFTVSATTTPDSPLTDAVLTVDATMPAHEHGMNVQPTTHANSDGSTTVSGLVFHMAGHWEVVVDVTQGDVSEHATFDIVLE